MLHRLELSGYFFDLPGFMNFYALCELDPELENRMGVLRLV